MQNEIALHVLVTLVCVHVGGDDGPQPRQETCCAVQRVIDAHESCCKPAKPEP